jgi:D-serine deaminase-like pyridoxal phosphate-dependent protein
MTLLPTRDEHISPSIPLEQSLPLTALETPVLLVDRERLDRNLEGMNRLARESGTRLRPHAKSHKCPALGRLQIEGGAPGLCVAKVSEGLPFLEQGMEDLLVAYPLLGTKADILAQWAARYPEGSFAAVADSPEGLDALGRAANREGAVLDIWLEVDVGLHRCGVAPDDPSLETLARRARHTPGLRLRGLLTHAGHVYKAKPEQVPGIGRAEGELMVEAAGRLNRGGLGPLEVSLGSTPTIPFSARVEGVSEIHPGVYVFGDRQQVALGAMLPDHVSLSVLATVVSHPAPGRWVLDAGSKTFSSDRGAHGTDLVQGYGVVRRVEEHRGPGSVPLPFVRPSTPVPESDPAPLVLTRLSEEHGVLESAGGNPGFSPGDRVEVTPNHACSVVNLSDSLFVTEGEGENRRVTGVWPVTARACVR